MKEIKYVLGFGIIIAVIDAVVLGVLKVVKVIDAPQFSDDLSRSMTVIGIIAVAALVLAFIFRMLKK
jgi:hypothetical protein